MAHRTRRPRPSREDRTPADAGFTLLEVVVAIALVGIIASAGFTVVTQSLTSSSTISQEQTATTLGNQAMERARSVPAKGVPADGVQQAVVTGLAVGRNSADVAAQWDASTHPDKLSSFPAVDPGAPVGSAPRLPYREATAPVVRGTTYTVETLVGTCYREREDTTSRCVGPDVLATPPPSSDQTWAVMARVMVEVSWTRAGEPCAGCSYYLTSLVDPTEDRSWIPGAGLQAIDDTVDVTPGTTLVIDVLENDIGLPASSNPVRIVTPPAVGTATVNSVGQILYTAPSNSAGTAADLTYEFTNTTGSPSNVALVTLLIASPNPIATDDAVTVPDDGSLDVVVLANDFADTTGVASPVAIVTGLPAGRGTLSLVGSSVRYTANAASWPVSGAESTSFTYRVTDKGGRTSNVATVTVRVVAPPVAASYTADTVRTASGATTYTVTPAPLPLGTRVDPATARVEVVSQPATGLGTVALTADRKGFVYTPGTGTGTVRFGYRIVQEGGTSATATITMAVESSTQHDVYQVKWKKDQDYKPGWAVTENDVPQHPGEIEIKLDQDKCAGPDGVVDDKIGQGSVENNTVIVFKSKERKVGSCYLEYRVIDKASGKLAYNGTLLVEMLHDQGGGNDDKEDK